MVTKAKVATAPVTANTPVAPVNGAQGKATPGGHVTAWRAQAKAGFNPTHSLKLLSTTNPWRPNTPGHTFWVKALAVSPAPATVGAALDLAKKAGIKGAAGHLAWLYTWGGAYVSVNGKTYPAQP